MKSVASCSTLASTHDDQEDALSSDNESAVDESTAAYIDEQHDMLSTTLAGVILPYALKSSIVQYDRGKHFVLLSSLAHTLLSCR